VSEFQLRKANQETRKAGKKKTLLNSYFILLPLWTQESGKAGKEITIKKEEKNDVGRTFAA
jgi:hypothetical protein